MSVDLIWTLQDGQDWIHGVGSRTDGEWLCCYCLVAQSGLTLAIPWTIARQAPLSMGFSRQEYWSG